MSADLRSSMAATLLRRDDFRSFLKERWNSWYFKPLLQHRMNPAEFSTSIRRPCIERIYMYSEETLHQEQPQLRSMNQRWLAVVNRAISSRATPLTQAESIIVT